VHRAVKGELAWPSVTTTVFVLEGQVFITMVLVFVTRVLVNYKCAQHCAKSVLYCCVGVSIYLLANKKYRVDRKYIRWAFPVLIICIYNEKFYVFINFVHNGVNPCFVIIL